jgi:ariadne-1
MSIYERNLEKCLVNLSRSHIKCPVKSCSNIIQINSSTIDNIRCRCGHQFCIDCKQEPHFPATCTSYQAYIDEMHKNGDSISELNTKTIVRGRNCISCDHFIEKNG